MERTRSARLLAAAQRHRRLLLAVGAVMLVAAVLAGAVAARGPLFFMSCDLDELAEHAAAETSVVLGADGGVLATIAPDEQRQPVPLEQVSPWLRKATIAIEDRRFYDHDGVDYRGLVRALVANVESGEAVQGGSTITQQLARTLYLSSERSLSRKLAEGCVAVALERQWPKDRILEEYLNRVYYGSRAHGANAAARTYFSKPAERLELPEAALLAGLPQAPTRLDPLRHPEAAVARRNQVLQALADLGELSEEELAQAREAPLGLKPSPVFGRQRDAFLANHVYDLLSERYGREAVRRGGFRVHTTIQGKLQRLAREAVLRTLDEDGDPAAALVALDPASGAVRAMAAVVPGRESVAFNLAVDGKRQAGSTFKAFALTEAVSRGINPWATRYLSAPFTGPETRGEPWQVKTYDETYVGRTTLADATLRSDNTVYARLIVDLGPAQVLETARTMGIVSELPAVPSIVLGSGDVSVLELTSAFGTLAALGRHVEPRLVQRVRLPNGAVDRWQRGGGPEAEQVLPEAVAHHVTRVLEANVEAGTGTGAQIGRPAAGKTGTTDEHTDAWFAGYTPQLVATVWIGYPEGAEPMEDVHGIAVTGGSFPATIWQRFMAGAHEGLPVEGFAAPEGGIEWKRFCGRVQFARTMADARPENGCPEPRRRQRTATAETETEPEPTTERRETTQETQTQPAPPPPTTTEAEPPPPPPPPVPPPGLVGRRGVVVVELPPDDLTPPPDLGEVRIGRDRWPARSEDGEAIPVDTEVEVVAIEQRHLVVRIPPPP